MKLDEEKGNSMKQSDSMHQNSKQISVIIGEKDNGCVLEDFAVIPNMLISGTTGSGKSSFVQTIMLEMMEKYSSELLKFIVYDSKTIDYKMFDTCPHMLFPIITDSSKVESVVRWTVSEAKSRMEHFDDINKMAHIFLILDDFSELALNYDGVIDSLFQLFQILRRVKIHCWMITSIPTATVVSTELKANIFYRVSFYVTSKYISRCVLDDVGAEELRFPGEMLIRHNSDMIKMNSAYFSDDEMAALLRRIQKGNPDTFERREKGVMLFQNPLELLTQKHDSEVYDEYFEEAGRLVIEKNSGSIGYLQRVFRINFNRAARIMDQLEEAGVVGPKIGTGPRMVLMDLEEFEDYMKL